MSQRKITGEALARIHAVEAVRRSIPTRKQLAHELGVSKSLVDQIANERRSYKMLHVEHTTMLDTILVQMRQAKP